MDELTELTDGRVDRWTSCLVDELIDARVD